jgi:hypothetical protein
MEEAKYLESLTKITVTDQGLIKALAKKLSLAEYVAGAMIGSEDVADVVCYRGAKEVFSFTAMARSAMRKGHWCFDCGKAGLDP